MGAMFSKPDTSKQEAMLKQQQERLDKQEREKMEALQARRRARSGSGMSALLSPDRPGAEQGLQSTLGPGGM